MYLARQARADCAPKLKAVSFNAISRILPMAGIERDFPPRVLAISCNPASEPVSPTGTLDEEQATSSDKSRMVTLGVNFSIAQFNDLTIRIDVNISPFSGLVIDITQYFSQAFVLNI